MVSCSNKSAERLIFQHQKKLDIELLNEILYYFYKNDIIVKEPYFTFFTYPYYFGVEGNEINIEKVFIYSLSPFESSVNFKKNSLLIYDLQFITSENNSVVALVGVFHRDMESKDIYYGLEFRRHDEKWILYNAINKEDKNNFFECN